MRKEIVLGERLVEKESISFIEAMLSENLSDAMELENRWKYKFDAVFTSLADAVVHFFTSRVKNEEIAQAQSRIRRIFRKTEYIDEIKHDNTLQKVFLLGYCHGVDKIMDSFEAEISHQQNDSLNAAVSSYKYVEPSLRILERVVEISHKELAQQLNISGSALSNFMSKVQEYHLFNTVRVGKNKYYSLAYPNGEEALKIIKDNGNLSANSYTDFLLLMMDSLIKISTCDDLDQDYVLKNCETMIRQYTTRPNLCIKKLAELALISKSMRVYRNDLRIFESNVTSNVTVFTKDITSEQSFGDVIVANLEKKIKYRWFITETDEFDSEDKVQNYFAKHFLKCNERKNTEEFMCNVCCYIIPKERTDSLFDDIFDAVIYDGNAGFSCKDDTISAVTPYFEMQHNILEKFNQYAAEQGRYFNTYATR
ncbi:MAG: hypothetical protein NC417_05950 [Candidatus Gastranaerophilales bacterium]|nr:hypothetical protein [Candidatus Gastranaerophilales bacterium]